MIMVTIHFIWGDLEWKIKGQELRLFLSICILPKKVIYFFIPEPYPYQSQNKPSPI